MIWLVVEETKDIKHEIVYGLSKEIGRLRIKDGELVFYKVSKGALVLSYNINDIIGTKVVTAVTHDTFISKELTGGDIPPDIMPICLLINERLGEDER